MIRPIASGYGFADPDAAVAAARRARAARDTGVIDVMLRNIRLRTAIAAARASVDALAHLLDQQREPLRSDDPAIADQGISLTGGNKQGGIRGRTVNLCEGNAVREDELLEGVKLISQLLDRIDVGIRHGLFSSGGEPEVTPAGEAAHRLSGGAK